MLTRRRFLGSTTIGLGGIAGCTNTQSAGDGGGGDGDDEPLDSDNDGVPDSRDDFPNDSSRSELLFRTSDTRKLEEDEWRYYNLSYSKNGYFECDFIIRDGPAIDVIMMEESEYSYFEEGERWEYYTSLSDLDTTGGDIFGSISPGNYVFIFDNSSRGEAYPPTNFSNDVIEVEFSFEGSQ